MTGIIITGHGHFPTGMLSAIELVAGKPEEMKAVDFTGTKSTEQLKVELKSAIDGLQGDDVLILADLLGGSPFNMAAVLKQEVTDKNIRVIAGVNMAAAVEATFSRTCVPLDELAAMVKEAGVNGVKDLDSLGEEAKEEISDGL